MFKLLNVFEIFETDVAKEVEKEAESIIEKEQVMDFETLKLCSFYFATDIIDKNLHLITKEYLSKTHEKEIKELGITDDRLNYITKELLKIKTNKNDRRKLVDIVVAPLIECSARKGRKAILDYDNELLVVYYN